MTDEKRPDAPAPQEKPLHAGHRKRMRARFAESGFDGYQPHEMLEQLLFSSYHRGNTNDLAHELLRRFGTLEGVLNASRDELMTVNGIGEKSAQVILSVRETVSGSICRQLTGTKLTRENVPFLADWFLGGKPEGEVCWIECGEERQILSIGTERIPEPSREALLAFGERMKGKQGILLVRCGKGKGVCGWNGEQFAFLDGVMSVGGGGLLSACILRGRKLRLVWKSEKAEPAESAEPNH